MALACLAARSVVRQAVKIRTGFGLATRCQSTVQVVFITPQGERIKATGEKGSTVLEVALDHGVDIEGACGGECACSTCHVIVQDQAKFDMLPPIELEEEDMLDLAAELEDTSRLCCQIVLKPELDGMELRLPSTVHSMLEDEYKS